MELTYLGVTWQTINRECAKYKVCQMVIDAGKDTERVKRLSECQCEG